MLRREHGRDAERARNAEHGADMVVVSRTLAQVNDTAKEISARGGKAVALRVDIARKADVDNAARPPRSGGGARRPRRLPRRRAR
jgi:NADP-dependent 3-hydroxy acid dehydrogenase YdfG